MEVAKYTIGVSFRFDPKEQRRLDDHLRKLKKKLNSFSAKTLSFNIDKFDVNQKRLNIALGNALDAASNKLVFQVNKFDINQHKLNGAMINAVANATVVASKFAKISPSVQRMLPQHQNVAHAVAPTNRVRASARGGELSPFVYGGSTAGVFSRIPFAAPALGLAAGGYGLAQLNERNQQVVAAQLQTQAVVQQAGGTAQQGTESFNFLRAQGNRIGFNYLEAAPDFNKLLSGLTGAGVSVQESQQVFKGFAELARVNKLDRVAQNRLFRALSQVAGKGKLQAEELTGQIAEALPGGTALFAQAYQRQIGGTKTGKDAISQLMEDMKKGRVKSDILTFAASLASERAQPGLDAASKASQAEQARLQNVVSDMALVASQNGVEEGFARIFRTLSAGLNESGGLVKRLAEGFNEATKWADDLLLFPQSFMRALEGRDSIVADWLGLDATVQLREDWNSIKESITTIMGIQSPSWLPTLEATAKELADLLRTIAGITGKAPTQRTEFSDIEKIDPFGTGAYTSPVGIFGAAFDNARFNMEQSRQRGQAVYGDPNSPFYKDPNGYDQFTRDRAMAQAEERVRESVVNSYDISIQVDPVTLANMDVTIQAQALADQFKMEIENTMIQFPVKE